MGFFNMASTRKYSMMAFTLLLAAILTCGIASGANAQVSAVSSGGSIAVTGPGGSFVSSGAPFISGGAPYVASGFAPERMVCYQNNPYGPLVCYRTPPNARDYSDGAIYRTPGAVIVQGASFV